MSSKPFQEQILQCLHDDGLPVLNCCSLLCDAGKGIDERVHLRCMMWKVANTPVMREKCLFGV